MEYKDIKTADELESWYTDKQAILDSHARDYMVPFLDNLEEDIL